MIETVIQENDLQSAKPTEGGMFNLQFFLRTFILNWQWYLLTVVLCVGAALAYLRYTQAVYQVSAKVLVKDQEMHRPTNVNKIAQATNLGFMSNSDGFDNELEVLKSVSVSEGAVRDLKLYVNYFAEGTVKKTPVYGNNPVSVDLDQEHLNELQGHVEVVMDSKAENFDVEVKVFNKQGKNTQSIEKKGTLPMVIRTDVGTLTLLRNTEITSKPKDDDESAEEEVKEKPKTLIAKIYNPEAVAMSYANGMGVAPLSKTTTIASLTRKDVIPQRAIDFLKQVTVVYNRRANEDKNLIAVRTEKFINDRLQKINAELGSADGAIETFKRQNKLVDPTSVAGKAIENTDDTDKKLVELQTQLLLLKSIKDYMKKPQNKYQPLPSNVGLTDQSAVVLINQYNNISLERGHLLGSASDLSPNVQTLTAQLESLGASIAGAIDQSVKNIEIQRNAISRQNSLYTGMISKAPQQERILTEIGRRQEVISSLYIMLLQKREENSIELAATADKGRLIDEPVFEGKVAPRGMIILLVALVVGLVLPFVIFVLMELLRFRIEGHEDVEKLTKLPIIADIATANDKAKTKGDIVVHENKNSHMEEIFRGMRTNLQFMLKDNQNVIMFTSSVSGEGKTFTAANLAVSFALLNKKVLFVGLDIRRPRLAQLFGIDNETNGITPLLVHESPSWEAIQEQIVPSGVNNNLHLLMAGPIPPNPAELVSRKTLVDIFDCVKEKYDYVIVDTAPVGLVSDTLQIAKVADATVIMCRADYTERSAFSMLNDLVDQGKLPNACLAINGIDMSKKKYGYAYGYGKYGKYGKYGYGNKGKGYGYHSYGYGSYVGNKYGDPNDDSIKQ